MEKSTYEDVLYEVDGPAEVITINREERLNAFRGQTIEELIHAFKRAWADQEVRGVILTGAGTRAFCVGGDVKQRAETGDYSFDGGFGSAYLARVVGEKRAREIWFLLEQYPAEQAERWGLVNKVVPAEDLMPAAKAWVNQLAQYSPTAIRFLKHSFNADTDHQGGLSQLSQAGLDVFAVTDEAREGAAAFAEKRKPDFTAHQVTH
jgi:1,4-dihydroxy-2-naphthoyl-CoA synthase